MAPNTAAAMEKYDSFNEVAIERERFELQQRKAAVYARSTLVPKDYRDNVGNVLIAMNMANRMGADLLMVMQNLYIVQGRPGWSAQFLIGTFNSNGRFSAIKYRFRGEEHTDDWACQAYCTEKETGDEITGTWVSWAMAKNEGWTTKTGSKWRTMPEQMFRYRGATFLIRATAPEIGLGLLTAEEIEDMSPVSNGGDEGGVRRVGVSSLKGRLNLVKEEATPIGDDVVDGEVLTEEEGSIAEAMFADEVNIIDEVDVAIAADRDPEDEEPENPTVEITPEEAAEYRLFELRKTSLEIFRDLEKNDPISYREADKWLGTKSITELGEKKLNEFLKKFAS